MSILRDEAIPYAAIGGRRSAHLISGLPGKAGTRELVTFAISIGMREAWLQNAGTATEHFDVFGNRLGHCDRLGVKVITRRELGTIIRAKREWLADPWRLED